MDKPTEQLRKILKLERSRGYEDTASPPPEPVLSLDSPITIMKGINRRMAARFAKLGVITVRDLLYFFPRHHIDYSRRSRIADLEPGIDQTIVAEVWQASEKRSRRGMRSTEAIVGDETGTVRVIWFNQPYLAKRLSTGTRIALSGKVDLFRDQKVFQSPEYEFLESGDLIHTGRLIPVYPLTRGLYLRQVRQVVKDALDLYLPDIEDFLPEGVRTGAGLMRLSEAIQQAHYPDNEFSKDAARHRLAFDELFLIQLSVLSRKRDWREARQGISLNPEPECLARFLASLPFDLTSAQRRVLDEIRGDLAQDKPMSRLLQGEVGSGKTVVATTAMLLAVASYCQAALMAPTEILAEQHFQNICRLLGDQDGDGDVCCFPSPLPRPIVVGLLTGGSRAKGELHRRIASGEIDILIGTHALIQKKVEFHRLGLVVVDEQHRFGVMQRVELRQKGTSPHMLVMSATPIPRTLALTLYGDLDISLIDELPPGRREIKTRWLSPQRRQDGYEFVRKQIARACQAFIICPLIEESENIEARAATAEYERLSQEIFPDLRLGLLHGRMSTSQKEEVMQRFRAGEIDVLVSTSVVEVGIDVPNATVMLVEGAERFGLAQLHQFRGRVWRSSYQSYCLLLSENPSVEGAKRLKLMEEIHNGFRLAEEDLRLRGPGEFFGTRQSGLPDLKMAQLSDVGLLEMARSEAIRLFESDPQLERSEHKALAGAVARLREGAK
ncbi:ATP-dependent DNA helicase RecG [Dehalococcoidia bacterium]|nr:ATP-dependent DNA helicase RecG [Dehalococcoidia bacterium]